MRIEKDGTLSLHILDVLPGLDFNTVSSVHDFTPQAEVAAHYAHLAGYDVQFVRPHVEPKLLKRGKRT